MEVHSYETTRNYSEKELDELVKKSPYYKATSNDVDWLSKVQMQGAVQKWVDHSISVTINLPNDVEEDLVAQLYMEAWKSGCKGVTVYRDGSRSGVLIANDESKDEKEEEQELRTDFPRKRAKTLTADIVSLQNT